MAVVVAGCFSASGLSKQRTQRQGLFVFKKQGTSKTLLSEHYTKA
jgi:hypothetical protein